MSSASDVTDAAIVKAFAAIPALLDRAPALIARGRFLDCECLLGPVNHPFHATIRAGLVTTISAGLGRPVKANSVPISCPGWSGTTWSFSRNLASIAPEIMTMAWVGSCPLSISMAPAG